ncbi:EamA family transporter [Kineosporia sp. A_224]|uniref:EamA family transporter n=1 Tax=Kineosporia sp. A_224 TaxID=1962180 RepID=UPI000B4BFCA1|nr:EamA family transporter [Kineosporia sp. A_224]
MVDAASPRPAAASAVRVTAALLAVYLVWGSTYLGIRVVVVAGLPPLVAMGVRFSTAGVILLAVLVGRSGRAAVRVTRRQCGSLALAGLLFLVVGNGFVAVAEQTVPSGLAALLVSTMPLWVVVLGALVAGVRTRPMTWLGTVVGFTGTAVLARPGGHPADVAWWGVGLVVLGTLGWATGSLLTPRLDRPADALVSAAYQMLLGGVMMALLGTTRGELHGFRPADVDAEGWVALAYLTFVGSLVAYTAFFWLLDHAPLQLVSTYAYVNPVVAVLLGWVVIDEQPTPSVLVGGAVAVLGVAVVITSERAGRRAPDPFVRRASTRLRPGRP